LNDTSAARTKQAALAIAKEYLPLAVALLCFWGIVAYLLAQTLSRTNHHLIYALDDAYIHMAIAKNVVAHGVWGLTPAHFANASSSPLWTALLALDYGIFGCNTVSPLVLNIVCASAVLVLVDRALRGMSPSRLYRALVLMFLMVATPLPSLVFTGQEHALHILLSLAFLFALTGDVDDHKFRFLALSALLPLARYEGIFLCAAGAGFLMIDGRRRIALLSLTFGIVPLLLIGLVGIAHGWPLIPISILLKGNLPRLDAWGPFYDFLRHGYSQIVGSPDLLFLLLAAAILFLHRWSTGRRWDDRHSVRLALFVTVAVLQMQFGRLRSFYRYEAYLVAMGLLAIAGTMAGQWRLTPGAWRFRRERLPAQCALVLLCAFPLAGLVNRAADAFLLVPRAVCNIYEQQVQMAFFVKEFYPSEVIAANDIGAISLYSDVDCLDLWGLASREVARYRLVGTYDREHIAELARKRGCRVALLYDSWFLPGGMAGIRQGMRGGLPESWNRAGEWTVPDKVVVADTTVAIYAIDPAELTQLCAHLKEFSAKLPRDVKQRGPCLD
jgi:hypothetical protein